MTLQQIHYALTIEECGSMNKAAEKLFMVQSALTAKARVKPACRHGRRLPGAAGNASLRRLAFRPCGHARKSRQNGARLHQNHGPGLAHLTIPMSCRSTLVV